MFTGDARMQDEKKRDSRRTFVMLGTGASAE